MANEMNRKRAAWAKEALYAFNDAKGEVRATDETEIGDLICDLLHFARFHNVNAAQIHAHAMRMFLGEVKDKE